MENNDKQMKADRFPGMCLSGLVQLLEGGDWPSLMYLIKHIYTMTL